jgi:hypothetical protein
MPRRTPPTTKTELPPLFDLIANTPAPTNEEIVATSPIVASQGKVWLKASFACHSFHYRMPDTVAIASVNPALPSPLTVQMAMLAAFLRDGEADKAQALLALMPLTIRIRPPQGAVIFRSLMRYVRPPKSSEEFDANTGSGYRISPHFREFALLDGTLDIFVQAMPEDQVFISEALEKIPYLGAKDSLVTCLGIENEEPGNDCVTGASDFKPTTLTDYTMVQLADFAAKDKLHPKKDAAKKAITLAQLIPGQRSKEHYILEPMVVAGRITSAGNVKIFRRAKVNS